MLALAEVEGLQAWVLAVSGFERAREDVRAKGALQGDQAPLLADFPVDGALGGVTAFELGGEVGEVFRFARGVGDDVEELGAEARDDRVVYYPARGWVEEAGEGGVVGLERGRCGRGDGFEEGGGAWAGDVVLNPV